MKRILGIMGVLAIASVLLLYVGSTPILDYKDYITINQYSSVQIAPKDTFSVMTYNLGYLSGMTNNLPVDRELSMYTNNMKRSIDLIQNYSPDIVGFQEIDFGAERSFFRNQMDSLALACEYPNASAAINWDKKYVPFPFWPPSSFFGRMISGQSVMSKGEILDVERIVLGKPEKQNFIYNAYYLERLVQLAKIKLGGREVIVLNVHLEAFYDDTRELQAAAVRAMYDRFVDDYPVLLIGDFNSEPASFKETGDKTMDIILDGRDIQHAYVKTSLKQNPNEHCTFSSIDPTYKIDYILYNPSKIRKIDYKVLGEAKDISDHLPVWMTFVFVNS